MITTIGIVLGGTGILKQVKCCSALWLPVLFSGRSAFHAGRVFVSAGPRSALAATLPKLDGISENKMEPEMSSSKKENNLSIEDFFQLID
jgi:hypothetical protein